MCVRVHVWAGVWTVQWVHVCVQAHTCGLQAAPREAWTFLQFKGCENVMVSMATGPAWRLGGSSVLLFPACSSCPRLGLLLPHCLLGPLSFLGVPSPFWGSLSFPGAPLSFRGPFPF